MSSRILVTGRHTPRLSGQSPLWRIEHGVAQQDSVALIGAGERIGTR